jgi:uncharacterized protein (DUF1697 family)
MPRYVVLLRGVNVGKGNRVPMADFRALLEGLGYSDVRTLLNSGNAAFTAASRSAPRLGAAIGDALQETFGFKVAVMVISAAGLDAAIAGNPAPPPADAHSRFLVAFGQDASALQALQVLQPLAGPQELFHIGAHAAYLLCHPGILDSKAAAGMVGKAGRGVTTRNWATVLKLRDLL